MSVSDPKPDSPRLTLVAVQSLDGCITRGDTPGIGFASQADQEWFQSVLPSFDSAIMGRKTWEAVRPAILAAIEGNPGRIRMVVTRRPDAWQQDHRPGILEFTDRSPEAILKNLVRRGKRNTILLGGATLNRLFLEADLVDRLWITLEPVIFGAGRRLVDGPLASRFLLEDTEHLSPSVLLLKYKRVAE